MLSQVQLVQIKLFNNNFIDDKNIKGKFRFIEICLSLYDLLDFTLTKVFPAHFPKNSYDVDQ